MIKKSNLRCAVVFALLAAVAAPACTDGGDAADNNPVGVAGSGGSAAGETGMGASAGLESAGAGMGSKGAALEIVSASLPDGSFNENYSVALEANGGSGQGFIWSLTDGALPTGLELSADGQVSGIPLEGGSFSFEVTVTDSQETTGSAELTLYVRRSRWLVYANGPELQAVDLTTQPPEHIVITQSLPANLDGLAGAPLVSPDGRFASYMVRISGEAMTTELHIVDLDADPPTDVVATELAEELFYAYEPKWSPDSKMLGFLAYFENDAGLLLEPVYAAYVNAEQVLSAPRQPANFVRIAQALNTLEWLSPDVVIYTKDDGWDELGRVGWLAYSVRDGGSFGAPEPIMNGDVKYSNNDLVHYLDRPSKRAVIGFSNQPHCLTMDLFDFETGVTDFGDDPLLPAPGLDLFAGTVASSLRIVDSTVQSIASLGNSACELIQWSPSGNLLGWASSDDKQYQVTRISNDRLSAETWPVPNGTYATAASRPAFSPDDRWIAYRADGILFVARIDAGGVSEPVRVSGDLAAPETDRVRAYRFAPNGKGLVYWAAELVPGIDELYFVDLSSGEPAPTLKLSPDLSNFPDSDEVLVEYDYDDYDPTEPAERNLYWTPWTPDSSKLVFIVRDPMRQVGDTLYVVDMLDPDPTPVQVDATVCSPADPYACRLISPLGIHSFSAPR